MAKTVKKTAGKASAKPTKKSSKTSTSSRAKTPKPSSDSGSKTGATITPTPRMSGEQVEKELAMAHKVIMGAGFLINYMLTTRRVSPKRIAEAAQRAADAAAYMQRLQSVIQSYAQVK